MGIVACRDDEMYPLMKGCIIIGFGASIVSTLIYGAYLLLILDGGWSRIWTIPCFGVLNLANSFNNVLISYNNRRQEYRLISSVYVVRNAVQNIVPLLFALVSEDALWLVVPYVFGQLCGLKRQSRSLSGQWRLVMSQPKHAVVDVLKNNRNYAVYSTPAMLANSFSYSSVAISLEALFSSAVVGYYSLSTRILGLPISLIGGNIAKVVFQESAEEYRETGGFSNAFERSLKILLPVALVSFIVIFLAAKPACVIFFGSSWLKAGEYIQLLAPMFSLQLICTALSPGLLVSQKQNIELLFQLALAFTTFLAIGIYFVIGGTETVFLIAICALKSVVYVAMILAVWKCSKPIIRKGYENG